MLKRKANAYDLIFVSYFDCSHYTQGHISSYHRPDKYEVPKMCLNKLLIFHLSLNGKFFCLSLYVMLNRMELLVSFLKTETINSGC